MEIKYNKLYRKQFSKLDKNIKLKAINIILIFLNNPFKRELNNHALSGKLKGKRSINITGNYRAIFKEYSDESYEFVEFVSIGTHSQLYK